MSSADLTGAQLLTCPENQYAETVELTSSFRICFKGLLPGLIYIGRSRAADYFAYKNL